MSEWSWKQAVAEEVLRHVNATASTQFSLADVYEFAPTLSAQFPDNRHVRDKIRQTLQRLRDDGLLRFLGQGRYELNLGYEDIEGEPAVPQLEPGFELPQTRSVVRNLRLRCTLLATQLKREYESTCQVCRSPLVLRETKFYAEAHHVRPLGRPHFGPDVPGNILVLCPNHHVMFDRGALAVAPISLEIRHAVSDQFPAGQRLFVKEWHKIGVEFLQYHEQCIFRA